MSHRHFFQTEEHPVAEGGSTLRKRSSAEATALATAQSGELARPDSSTSSSAEPSGTCRLLLVEDDPNLGPGLKAFFSSKGYEVTWVKEGTDAPSLVASMLPDLVLLDLRLPQKDGFEVLREIKEKGAGVPVLILTALQKRAYEQRCRELGAAGYYQKPFDLKRLARRIEELAECA